MWNASRKTSVVGTNHQLVGELKPNLARMMWGTGDQARNTFNWANGSTFTARVLEIASTR